MRRMIASVGVAVVMTIGSSAADKPNFSGRWTSAGESFTIAQNASTLTIAFAPGVLGERTLVYRLDGSDSRNVTTTIRGEEWTHVSRVKWVSAALVIFTTTTRAETGNSWEWMAIYSFPDATRNLSVTTVDAVLTSSEEMATQTRIYKMRPE